MGDTLPEVAVTGLPPVDLYNGTSADITPWAETVQIDIFENAKAASGETLRTVNLSVLVAMEVTA